MIFNLLKHLKFLNSRKDLISLDGLYKDCISKLPLEYRINYCQSLLYTTSEDLKKHVCETKRKTLKKLLQSIHIELKNLNNQIQNNAIKSKY